jgi:hypothetical protein
VLTWSCKGLPNILLDASNNTVPILASKCSGVNDILKIYFAKMTYFKLINNLYEK